MVVFSACSPNRAVILPNGKYPLGYCEVEVLLVRVAIDGAMDPSFENRVELTFESEVDGSNVDPLRWGANGECRL